MEIKGRRRAGDMLWGEERVAGRMRECARPSARRMGRRRAGKRRQEAA